MATKIPEEPKELIRSFSGCKASTTRAKREFSDSFGALNKLRYAISPSPLVYYGKSRAFDSRKRKGHVLHAFMNSLCNPMFSQLLIRDGSKAKKTIAHALTKDPNDTINCNIRNIIDEVLQGRRETPKTLLDLMTPQPKKKSLLSKLFGFRK